MIERHYFKIIESTQEFAKKQHDLLQAGTWRLITADQQTQGRATNNKHWQSPAGVNLYATFSLLIPNQNSALLFNVPQVTAYAIIKSLQQFKFEAKFKWVNDILINRKKVCGILCEAFDGVSPSQKGHKILHIGMGINVNMAKDDCDKIDQPVTSLMLECGHKIDKEELLNIIQTELYKNINLLFTHGFEQFHPELDNYLEYKNEEIQFDPLLKNSAILTGLLVGIDNKGQLILKLPNGDVKTFYHGRLMRAETLG